MQVGKKKAKKTKGAASHAPTVVINHITPQLDGGKFPIKRITGETLHVESDIFKDGHDSLSAVVRWRKVGRVKWLETPMEHYGNDRWGASIGIHEIGNHEYTVAAWANTYDTWLHGFQRKHEANEPDMETEIQEGAIVVETAAANALENNDSEDAKLLHGWAQRIRKMKKPSDVLELMDSDEVHVTLTKWPDRRLETIHLPLKIKVERNLARFSSWYEFFPRSAKNTMAEHATFRDCVPMLEHAKSMGFDVIYFPPIHPIGVSNRKGKNNSVSCEPDDVGSPWAIGGPAGGHYDVEPALGSVSDFEWLVKQADKLGLEIALDFALNCSPDHPYVKDHPDWFVQRPDGTIKYAENPPKKYQDIYPLDFHCEDWKNLWEEMVNIVRFWIDKGVKIFRVDNPHTKPVHFWEFLIGEIHKKHPEVIFLSEAFTQPRMMEMLGKIGFTQSYTYFTWRNDKAGLTEYLTELTQSEMNQYYRGNLWPNTPDILHAELQDAPPARFRIRAALAATLSSTWGMYSGFELCEGAPLPGREEYLDSEKYQLKDRDYGAPGSIVEFIGKLNWIRKGNAAMHEYANLRFIDTSNDQVIAYLKRTADGTSIILTIVSLDPFNQQDSNVHVPGDLIDLYGADTFQIQDLLTDETYEWKAGDIFVSLNPDKVAHIFRVDR